MGIGSSCTSAHTATRGRSISSVYPWNGKTCCVVVSAFVHQATQNVLQNASNHSSLLSAHAIPSHAASVPSPSHAASVPSPSLAASMPSPSLAASVPSPSHGCIRAFPSHAASVPSPSHAASVPSPSLAAIQQAHMELSIRWIVFGARSGGLKKRPRSVSLNPLQVGCPFCHITACKQVLLMQRWPHLMCYNSCTVWLALDTPAAIPLCGDKIACTDRNG